jgi:hypothetical protein
LEGRLAAITSTLTDDVYSYACLGLFERHKLMFSFQMAVKVLETGPEPLDAQVRPEWQEKRAQDQRCLLPFPDLHQMSALVPINVLLTRACVC